jgi:hypothetical protein
MKFKLSILFLLVNVFSFSQKVLEGEFRLDVGGFFYGDSYTFTKDGKFEFSSGHCTGGSFGKGNYKIRSGYLKLNFEDSIPESNTTYNFEKKDSDNAENNQLEIVVFNAEDSSFLEYCVLYLRDSLHPEYISNGDVTNLKGETSLLITNENQIELNYVGFKKLQIPVDSSFNGFKLIVYLSYKSWIDYLTSKDNKKIKIKNIQENRFELKSKRQKKFNTYKITKKAPQ